MFAALGEDILHRPEPGFGGLRRVPLRVLDATARRIADALFQPERLLSTDCQDITDTAVIFACHGFERLVAGRGPVVHGNTDALPGFRCFPGETERAVAAVDPYRQQNPARVAAGPARIMRRVVLHRLVLAVDDGGCDVGGNLAVRRYLERNAEAAARGEAHCTPFGGGHRGTGPAPPGDAAFVDAGGEVNGAAVVHHGGFREGEALAVDDHREVIGIRNVDDPLSGPGEAERVLGMLDVPDLVEAVDEAARQIGVRCRPVGTADAQMPVA